MKRIAIPITILTALLAAPSIASAMCGCMMPVDDTGIPETTTLTSDATQVVLMRAGNKTIQTMQNRYEGPVENFALIVPTPVVLSEQDVKTLDAGVFARIDNATAPRLIEYFEHDPCEQVDGFDDTDFASGESTNDGGGRGGNNAAAPQDPGVVVEAEFAVGEYNIQILSSEDGIELETWLTDNGYRVPQGASKYLQPYLNEGMYFFVAQVDVEKVKFDEDGQAVLSPLRFQYDQPGLVLPTRLGMMNSAGKQDLIVYVLGETRFEAANFPNATIPTNVSVRNAVKNDFAGFYDQLFSRTLEESGGAVVTEFAGQPWQIQEDFETLGGDVARQANSNFDPWNMVLTRLHVRYEKDDLGEDIIFETATGINGGQEAWNERTVDPTLMKQGAVASEGWNGFQATFMIKNHWEGAVNCENPQFNRWGGDPSLDNGAGPQVVIAASPNTTGRTVFLASDAPLEQKVAEDVPQIDVEQQIPPKDAIGGCSSNGSGQPLLPIAGLFLMIGFGFIARRK